jgi:hypothetical protein
MLAFSEQFLYVIGACFHILVSVPLVLLFRLHARARDYYIHVQSGWRSSVAHSSCHGKFTL